MPIIQSFCANDFQFEKHYLIYLKALFVLSVLSSLICMVDYSTTLMWASCFISWIQLLWLLTTCFFELPPGVVYHKVYI